MTTDYPTTNRPSTIQDVSRWQREPQNVASRPEFTDPAIAQWWGTTLAAAATTPGLRVTENGEIVRPKTLGELQDQLKSEQSEYDRGREQYIKWAETGVAPDWTWLAQNYAKAEGLDLPTTDKEQTDD